MTFLPSRHGGERTHVLSQRQAIVVACFLDECAQRYPNANFSADFAAAATHVRESVNRSMRQIQPGNSRGFRGDAG